MIIFKKIKQQLFQKFFRKKVSIKKSWELTPKNYNKMLDFLKWFDDTNSVDDSINKGKVDWDLRFKKYSYFNQIKKDTALEIGFGGGRLLIHAAKDFKRVIGVDIHQNFLMTRKFLSINKVNNYQLLNRKKLSLIPDNSINLVYSFIVFQHFDSFEEVEFYLSHIKRILVNDGISHIYFGKNQSNGIKVTKDDEFFLRDCSLFINMDSMKKIIKKDFTILSAEKKVPKDILINKGESVQSMIIFQKKLI